MLSQLITSQCCLFMGGIKVIGNNCKFQSALKLQGCEISIGQFYCKLLAVKFDFNSFFTPLYTNVIVIKYF